MAPKRKRAAGQRPSCTESSFTDCPACQMKVVSHLINHHLDWDCLALVQSKEQPVLIEAAETTNALLRSLENKAGAQSSDLEVEGGLIFVPPDENFHHPCMLIAEKKGPLSPHKCTAFQLDGHSCNELGSNIHNDGSDASPKLESDTDFYHKKSGIEFCSVSSMAVSAAELKESSSGCNVEAKDLLESSEGRSQSSAGASTLSPKFANKDGWGFITASLPAKVPKGHYVIEDFISEKEEEELVSFLDMDIKNPWKVKTFNGIHVGKAYGLSPDLKQRCIGPAAFEMPGILVPLFERMRLTVPALKDFWPNETNAIEYCKHKRHWLKPHVDDRQLSGTVLVNLSLCGDCKMTYERERGHRESYKVLLRRRSIQIQTGDCRYNFTHSILNEDLLGPRRVSMTFRQSVTL